MGHGLIGIADGGRVLVSDVANQSTVCSQLRNRLLARGKSDFGGRNLTLVVDDVDANWGFQLFNQTIPDQFSLICEAEPLHPDLRRFNKKGLFGIILKTPISP